MLVVFFKTENIIRNIYEKRYNIKIPVSKNSEDKIEYADLEVKNQKLRNLIKFTLHDSLEDEINKIFNKLEKINNPIKI